MNPKSLYLMNSDEIIGHIMNKLPSDHPDRYAHSLPLNYERLLENLFMIFKNPSKYGVSNRDEVYIDYDKETKDLAIFRADLT